mmetsp:Transcript_7749/g.11688  ORF Transcript_7749/g.11688 Transcript_7749/m.11688 type:complete len:336 (+) Transcript_7749:40-1047(+)|eukprot:CAMPEP_0171459084 /NCGR_PEP_ID=MMETSP0945-20130129/4507_1 /TAXON_ID=109269 /ORGANISM="Vaucheria litorea, Strain CCMP2940" /LENGTH=335 /DNA_ID=CAMNT_0011985027 /DNA_START=39 /DNA_END=1046 /DNA_ORIENTATION=+
MTTLKSDEAAIYDSVGIDHITDASNRISSQITRTPILTCSRLDQISEKSLFFKCENFQKTGSFKARGACNAVSLLPPFCKNVLTHSSGNHALALSWAAKQNDIDVHCVMPSDSSLLKMKKVKEYGAEVVRCEPSYSAREKTANELVEKFSASFVHSSNDFRIINGQGTVGLEVYEQIKEMYDNLKLDAIIVPVGGGGLLSGVALAMQSLSPDTLVIGAEPKMADDAARSLAKGELLGHDILPNTIADGLRTKLGDITWPIIKNSVKHIITVTEDEIKEALRLIFEEMKIVVEPSGAVTLAAALSDEMKSMNGLKNVGIVLSGGNVDPSKISKILE